MIKLPQNNWKQSNRSNILGDIVESFNLDLNSVIGKVKTFRTKRVATGDGDTGNFGPTSAITFFNNIVRVFSNGIQYDGSNSPLDSLVDEGIDQLVVSIIDGDATNFNQQIYGTNGTNIKRSDGANTASVSTGLTANTKHLLTTFTPDGNGERLYVSEGGDKVWSVNTSNTLASSSTYTLDTNLSPDYEITVLMAGEDRIWVGLSSAGNNALGGKSIMLEWDGVTANTPSAKYYIDATRIMAGVIKDDVPFIIDSLGRLLAFNGGVFSEVDRLPLKGQTMQHTTGTLYQNAIHPRGMTVDGDDILICLSALRDGSSGTRVTWNNLPSGVWAWNERNGFHHKLSPSFQAVADTGTTNLTDYGQFRAAYGGPIKVFETENTEAADGGRIMFAMSYFTGGGDSLNALSDITYGIWADDTHDDTQKAGYFVTPQIHSSVFRDRWNEIYASLSELETIGDLVEIKYRTTDEEPTVLEVTWKSDQSSFSTTADLSDLEQGDEVQVIQGTGSGACAHIDYISGTKVQLDRVITGVVGTAKIRLQKYKKIASISDIAPDKITLGERTDYIQLKVYLQWTGPREFNSLLINNKKSILT